MLTNRILSSVKSSDIILETDGLDDTTAIPIELAKCLTKPVVSVTDLGKLLLQCCKDGETTKVHELMCRGAPFSTDWLGTSPIHLTAMNNHLSTCEVLLRAGISKDAKTKVDRTPLHFAVYEGHEKMVELLLKHKCEVDAKDMLKMTPLHWAVQMHHKRIVELLLEHNADPNVISKFDKTPLIIAHETTQMDVVKILEQAISNRLENPDQTQEATDQLVFEMQQESANGNHQHDSNSRIPPLTPIELDIDYQNIFNMGGSNHQATTPSGANINNLVDTSSMIDEDSNIIEDSDDGTSLSDAIIQLQNIDEPKAMDASALQLLKEHGISMLSTEDTDNSLITSALQSGRKLVLSEAGKLVLNDPKFRKLFMDGSPSPSSTSLTANSGGGSSNTLNNFHSSPLVKQSEPSSIKGGQNKKPTMIVSARNFPLKTNKVIKILSAEQFKQMCGGDLTSAIKKISHEPQKDVRFSNSSGKSPTVIHLNTPKVKKPVMSKTKINLNPTLKSSITFKSPPMHALHQHFGLENGNAGDHQIQTQNRIPIHPLNQQHQQQQQHHQQHQQQQLHTTKYVSSGGSPAVTSNRNPNSNSNNINNNNNNNSSNLNNNNNSNGSLNSNEVVTGTMTMLDIEKQIVEMKRHIEDLLRKFELSQKQNDELRLKVQRLERHREMEDHHHHNNNTDDIEILEYTNCID